MTDFARVAACVVCGQTRRCWARPEGWWVCRDCWLTEYDTDPRMGEWGKVA